MKQILEHLIIASRWIQAPIYLGLTVVIFFFVIVIMKGIVHLAMELPNLTETKLVLSALELCDAVLIANLLFIVVISGYINFISDIVPQNGTHKVPSWLKELSHGDVKTKIAISLVAISSIQLLKQFMNIQERTNTELAWYVGIHMTFVISALLCSYIGKQKS